MLVRTLHTADLDVSMLSTRDDLHTHSKSLAKITISQPDPYLKTKKFYIM